MHTHLLAKSLRARGHLRSDAERFGFYAIAYGLPPGYIDDLSGTVISYRG